MRFAEIYVQWMVRIKTKTKLTLKTKITIWVTLVFLLSLGLWRYVDYVLNVVTPNSWQFDIELAGAVNIFVLLSLSALGLMVFKQKRIALALAGALGAGFVVIFGLTWINLLGVGVVVLMFLSSRQIIQEEMSERAKINPRTILRRGMTPMFISIAILASFAAYQSPVAESLSKMEQLPSAGYRFVHNVSESVVKNQFSGQVPLEQRDQIIEEVTTRATGQLNTVFQAYKDYVPPALAFALFAVALSVSWIFVWISVLLGSFIFALLKLLKVVKVEEYEAKAERLVI